MFGREYVDHIASHAKGATRKIHVVALVLHAHQLGNDLALIQLVAFAQGQHHLMIGRRVAYAVDGRYGSHNDHVTTLEQAFGARQSHLFDVLVDGRVFFNEQIALRHIGFGLVVVVVTHKVLDCIARKKLPKLRVQLCSQSFVGRKHNGGAPNLGNHVGHGERFARAGDPQQRLKHLTIGDSFDQFGYGRGLIAARCKRLKQLKGRVVESHEFTHGA